MATPEAFAPIAIASRNGVDESIHFGAVVGLAADGTVATAVGDPATIVFPRSSNKPMQAVAMLRAGLTLPPDLLALACASHDGTATHLDAARRILASAGLGEDALANTPSFPLDTEAAQAVLRAGGGATPLQMNCSGKHAAMLATCVHRGWAHDERYLDQQHPLQVAVTDTIEELAGETCAAIGVDGCGAPAHAFSLVGLARAFRAIATGAAGAAGRAVAEAMTTHPVMVGGAQRDVTLLMQHVPGLVAKDGAEGVFAAALPDGRAVAVKVADGGDRARPPVMLAALRALGVDVGGVAPLVVQRIMGHGRPVGDVRAIAP